MESIEIKESLGFKSDTSFHQFIFPEIERKLETLDLENQRNIFFIYIDLALFLELFFHFYIRLITEFVFKNNDEKLLTRNKWRKAPHANKYILNSKSSDGKFSIFLNDFNLDVKNYERITENMDFITKLRNKLIHGHPIFEETMDGVLEDLSDWKEYKDVLSFEKLKLILDRYNIIAQEWNTLVKKDLVEMANSMEMATFFEIHMGGILKEFKIPLSKKLAS